MVTKIELGKRIKALRDDFDLKQQELADRLGIARSAISQIESGERNIAPHELQKVSEIFDISIDELLRDTREEKTCSQRKSGSESPKFKKDKFKQLLLYILEKCAGKPNFGETVLYKLFYFIDFNYYELYEESLSGASYRKIDYGPAPCQINDIIGEMIAGNEIKKITVDYHGKRQKKYFPLIEANMRNFSAEEKEVMDNVIDGLSSKNASDISVFSHEDVPWEITKDKELINYEYVFYRAPAYSVRSYAED